MGNLDLEGDSRWPLLICPSCRTLARAWVINRITKRRLECPNPVCAERHSWLTRGIPVVAAPAARQHIAETDVCGPLPATGKLGEWLGRWKPGTQEFDSVGRAAIYLDAMRPNGGSGFYRELCDALLPGAAGAPGNALDVGCGLGNLAFELGRRVDDIEWVLVDAPRLRRVHRVHGRLLRKER